jgi:FG-GAP repeat
MKTLFTYMVAVVAVSATACGPSYIPPGAIALTASNGDSDFPASVGISGTTAVVGDCPLNLGNGAAYVFVKAGSGWSQSAELTASDASPNTDFGCSVAISGSTVIVGAGGVGTAGGTDVALQ